MPEEKLDPPASPTETGKVKDVKDTTKDGKSDAPKPDDVETRLQKLEKRLSDKDSHITKIEGENRELRDTITKMSDALTGKTEKQKDALSDQHRKLLIDEGYDEKSVDLILRIVDERSEDKAQKKIAPLIMEAAQDLVESDPDIDLEFLEKNSDAVMSEYNSYKQEVSPRKIKQNLKKAYKIIKEQLAEKAKTEKPQDKSREDMISGAKPEEQGKPKDQSDKDFIEAIEKSGSPNSIFI